MFSRRMLLTMAGSTAWAFPTLSRAGEPPKVLLIGASSMDGFVGRALEHKLRDQGLAVHREAKGSSGLARWDFYDWPEAAKRLRREVSPDVSVVMFGGNDAQGMRMPRGHEPRWIRWHEPGWSEEYCRRVLLLAEALSPNYEPLLWLASPPMRSGWLTRRLTHISHLAEKTLAGRPNAHFLRLSKVLAGSDGGYADELKVDGELVPVREPDGIHINMNGSRIVGDWVTDKVLDVVGRSS